MVCLSQSLTGLAEAALHSTVLQGTGTKISDCQQTGIELVSEVGREGKGAHKLDRLRERDDHAYCDESKDNGDDKSRTLVRRIVSIFDFFPGADTAPMGSPICRQASEQGVVCW